MSKFGGSIFWIATTSNYILLILSSLQKSAFLKWTILFFQYFGAKIEISDTNSVEKKPIFFFGSKINRRKKLEINEKIPKT